MNFKNTKILKPITIVTLLYSAYILLKYFGDFFGIFTQPESPLIPKYLSYYVAFPSYIIIPFFLIIVILCLQQLKLKFPDYKIVYVLFGFVVLFFIFHWKIYDFIMSFNPYGS